MLNDAKDVWKYETEEEKRKGKRGLVEYIMLVVLGFLAFFILCFGFYFFPTTEHLIEPLNRDMLQLFIQFSMIAYTFVVASGILRQDFIGGTVRGLWFLSLICQVPYTLIFDTIELNPLFTLLVGALLVRHGWAYIGLAVFVVWLLPFHSVVFGRWIVLATVLLPLVIKHVLLLVDNQFGHTYKKRERREHPYRNIQWCYLFLLIVGVIFMYK